MLVGFVCPLKPIKAKETCQLHRDKMPGFPKSRSIMQFLKNLKTDKSAGKIKGNNNHPSGRFKTILDRLGFKKLTALGLASLSLTGYKLFASWFSDFEEGGGNMWTDKYLHYKKEKERRKMIETDVGPGLAWSYFANYLKQVLEADIEAELEKQTWFKSIYRSSLSRKLYVLIPRKCYVDIEEADDNIEHLGSILSIGDNEVQLYSIKDGETIYYCTCVCPRVLKTINHVNDIQMAGISRSKYRKFDLPWNRNSIIELFNDNTKMVQLMRFYYTLSSFLRLHFKDKHAQETPRLILFNESAKKPSEILLQAIKEDINVKIVDKSEKVNHRSLMEKTLLSTEENREVLYDYDVFVTHRRELNDEEKKNQKEYAEDLGKIYDKFQTKGMKVLLEKECLGKDWLTKLKYAATKCRWIVFLDTKESNSSLFTSHKLTNSLQSILEPKKVQTVAIVNQREDRLIFDDLNLVACIPYQQNKIKMLYNVISGADINLLKPIDCSDVYLRPGEIAVGLAWDYAANHLNKFLPDISDKKRRRDGTSLKLYIGVPDSCEEIKYKSFNDELQTLPSKPINLELYDDGLEEGSKKKVKKYKYVMALFGEYPKPIDVIRQMKESKLITEKQMKSEVEIFCKTVDKIIEILLPEKTFDYEFVYFNDKETEFITAVTKRDMETKLMKQLEPLLLYLF